MTKSRDELICMLDQLAADMQGLIENNPDTGAFWAAFAEKADPIENSTGQADNAFVHGRIDAILISYGLPPTGWEDPDNVVADQIDPANAR